MQKENPKKHKRSKYDLIQSTIKRNTGGVFTKKTRSCFDYRK